MNKHRLFGLISVAGLALVVIITASYIWEFSAYTNIQNTGFMTGAELSSLNASPPGIYVSHSNSTIYLNNSVDLPVMMGPMDAPSMYSFEILGMFNPTLTVMQGTTLDFTVINVDTDSYHNFVMSHSGPPYYMGSMMQSSGLMNNMNFLPPVHSGSYAYSNLSYSFSTPGTYWYLCTYPGHAAEGMYGKIVVV